MMLVNEGTFRIIDDKGRMIIATHSQEHLEKLAFSFIKNTLKDLGTPAKNKEWHFTHHPCKRLSMFLEVLPDDQKLFGDMARMAVDQGVDLLEICTGDWMQPRLFLVTPNLNIASLRREWTKLFCKAHGLRIQLDDHTRRMH